MKPVADRIERGLPELSVRRPFAVLLAAALLLVIGIVAHLRIPLEYVYDAQPPRLVVSVRYPGAAADVIAADLTAALEGELRAVPAVRRVVSRSMDGAANLRIEFDADTAFDDGERQVRDRLNKIRYRLPRDIVEPDVYRVGGGNDQAVLEFGVTGEGRSRAELSEFVTSVVRPRLQAVPGVGEIYLSGAEARQLVIEFDPVAAAALAVDVDDVVRAIRSENVDARAGHLMFDAQDRVLRIAGRMKTPADFERIVVSRRQGMPVALGDLARVTFGAVEAESVTRLNGRDCVSVRIFPLPKADVALTSERLRSAMQALSGSAPAGIALALIVDNSEYAGSALRAVQKAMLEGAALTCVLVCLALRSGRSALITSVTLPLGVLSAVAVLWLVGGSLNLFTLLGLTLSIGVLIDDAIVVRESIVRHQAAGLAPGAAAVEGTRRLFRAVSATTLAIVATVLPIGLVGGTLGRFLMQFGIAVAVAVLTSLLVSFTVDPALSVLLHRRGAPGRAGEGPVFGRVARWAAALAGYPAAVLAACALLLGAGLWCASVLPVELTPEADESIAFVAVDLPPGSPASYVMAKTAQVEAALHEFAEVRDVFSGMGILGKPNHAWFFVRLVPPGARTRSSAAVGDALVERVQRIGGVDVGSGTFPVQLMLSGADDVELEKIAAAVRERLARIKGVINVNTGATEPGQVVRLELQREQLSDVNLPVDRVARALNTLVGGESVGTWFAPNGRQYDIAVRLPARLRGDLGAVIDLELATAGEGEGPSARRPLRSLVGLHVDDGLRAIERLDGRRLVQIRADVNGRPLGEVTSEVSALVAGLPLRAGYDVTLGGRIKELEDSKGGFALAAALACALLFAVLAMFFGGIVLPAIIMASIPLGTVGALLALWLTGSSLNVFSGIGLLLLAGLVAKNGVLLVDQALHLEAQGLSREQAVRAALDQRVRPILMTSGAMLFGMLPVALGATGQNQLAPMGIAILSGVVLSTVMSLVVIPLLLRLAGSRARRRAAVPEPAASIEGGPVR